MIPGGGGEAGSRGPAKLAAGAVVIIMSIAMTWLVVAIVVMYIISMMIIEYDDFLCSNYSPRVVSYVLPFWEPFGRLLLGRQARRRQHGGWDEAKAAAGASRAGAQTRRDRS